MKTTLNLPALDADVVIDGDTVLVTSSDGTAIQLGIEEWETMRKAWLFDDIVDYKNGETPMTAYQFRVALELSRQVECIETLADRIKAEMGKA